MKTKILLKIAFSFTLISLIGVTIASGQGTSSAVRYRLLDLGADGVGNEILDSGRIVGSHNSGGSFRHGAFWPNIKSLPVDLGTLPGDDRSGGFGMNSRGQMVGFSNPADFFLAGRPVFWASSQSAPIELPGLPAGYNLASAINSAGKIVGQFAPLDDSGIWPVFWANNNSPAIYLKRVSDELPFGAALSINAAGNILGDACSPDFSECHVAFWAGSNSTPVALASPEGDFTITDLGLASGFVMAHALNNAGGMVGFASNPDTGDTRAVYWASSSSPAIILSTSAEFPNGTADAINDRNQIVGTAYNSDFSASHAFIWPTPASPGIDLTTAIRSGSGYEVVVARSINNRGEITGAAYPNGESPAHAIVLVPVHGQTAIEK